MIPPGCSATLNTGIRISKASIPYETAICFTVFTYFCKVWFITTLGMAAYATLTRRKAFVEFFPVQKDHGWKLQSGFLKVPYLLKHVVVMVFFLFLSFF